MEALQRCIIKFWEANMQPCGVMTFVILIELIKWCFIMQFDPFSDGDFTSYTEQSKQFWDGERDLSKINGKNGPWLYPALHVYTFVGVYWLTGIEEHLKYAQIINTIIHILTWIVSVKIYYHALKDRTPQHIWLVALWCIGTKVVANDIRRIYAESYNVLLVYFAILLFQKGKHFVGWMIIAVAMGFKMSVLLYFPAIYYIVSKSVGVIRATIYIGIIMALQLVWAIPFISEYPDEYINTAFKFDRKFSIMGSINFHWILYSPLFHSSLFTNLLLLAHVGLLLYVLFKKWLPLIDPYNRFNFWLSVKEIGLWPLSPWMSYKEQDPYLVAEVFFVWNYIGCACSRTLHQQFLVWLWYSLPFIWYAPLLQKLIDLRRVVILLVLMNLGFTMVSNVPCSIWALIWLIYYLYLIVKSDMPIKDGTEINTKLSLMTNRK